MRTTRNSLKKLFAPGVLLVFSFALCGCSGEKTPDSDREPNIIPIETKTDHSGPAGSDICHFVSAYYDGDIIDSADLEVTEDGYIRGTYGIYSFDTRILTDMDQIGHLSVTRVNCGETSIRDGLAPGWLGVRYYFNAFNMGGDLNIFDERSMSPNPANYNGEPDYDLTRATYESFDVISFTDRTFFSEMTSRVHSNGYDYSDVIPFYSFSIDGMDRSFLAFLEQRRSYDADKMDVYIVRQEKDNIPITFYNSMYVSRFIAWDDGCMGFAIINEYVDNADLINGVYVPIDISPYNIEMIYEEDIEPVNIEDCIANCIPEIAYDTSDMNDILNVDIYSAELTYIKVDAFNTDTMGSYMWSDEFNSPIYWLIPVWKITYFAEDSDGMTRIGAVMLNAKTGTGMEVDNEFLQCGVI